MLGTGNAAGEHDQVEVRCGALLDQGVGGDDICPVTIVNACSDSDFETGVRYRTFTGQQALSFVVKDTMGNLVLSRGIEKVTGGLREGQSLADPLSEVPYFSSFAVHMIRVGEESGELESILAKVAQTFDRDTQVTIKRTMTLLEPMLILVLGVVIAAVIISILVAILSINELGIEYVTWDYDALGRAVGSESVGGLERTRLERLADAREEDRSGLFGEIHARGSDCRSCCPEI